MKLIKLLCKNNLIKVITKLSANATNPKLVVIIFFNLSLAYCKF
jgi:hypothetical protein